MTKPMRALIVRICVMLALLGYAYRSPQVRIISIPQPIKNELLGVYAAQGVVGPWVKHKDTRDTLTTQYSVLTPRIPYAGSLAVCVGDDGMIVSGACPYAVDIVLDVPADYALPAIFDVIKVLHSMEVGKVKTLHVMIGGTVYIKMPHYTIILGRKQLVKRLLLARKVLASPSWKYPFGVLDLRYHDGFVYKELADPLIKAQNVSSQTAPSQTSKTKKLP